MDKKTACLIYFLVIFFTAPSPIYSQIVINELLPNPLGSDEENEWIELYNKSADAVDLTNYVLKDAADHQLIITADYVTDSTIINPLSWLVVKRNGHSTFSLNNSGEETVHLLNTENALLDSFSYNGCAEDKSWGRIPDGESIFADKLDTTPGLANQPPPPPTPTPEPTEKPTPTLSPKPTSILTSVPTKKIVTAIPTVKPTTQNQILGESDNSEDILLNTEDNKSSENDKENFAEDKSEKQDQNGNNHHQYLLPVSISIVGLILLLVAGAPMIKVKLSEWKKIRLKQKASKLDINKINNH